MKDILDWLSTYSPVVVTLILLAAAMLFVLKQTVEKSIASGIQLQAKEIELAMARRSAFQDKVLSERYSLVTSLSARLQRAMTNLNRIHHGKTAPDGFMQDGELRFLTEVFEDIEIHRLILGEDFHPLFVAQARLALDFANAGTPEETQRVTAEWLRTGEQVRAAAEKAFRIAEIQFTN